MHNSGTRFNSALDVFVNEDAILSHVHVKSKLKVKLD